MQIRVNENKTVVAVNSKVMTVNHILKNTRVVINRSGERIVVNRPSTTVRIVSAAVLQRVVVDATRIRIVAVAKQGPPGVSGSSLPNLDTMFNPLYPISRRVFESGTMGIEKVSVYSGITGGVLLFERTISYDDDGRVSVVQTDDIVNHDRLTKRIEYGVDYVGIRREMTTWQ